MAELGHGCIFTRSPGDARRHLGLRIPEPDEPSVLFLGKRKQQPCAQNKPEETRLTPPNLSSVWPLAHDLSPGLQPEDALCKPSLRPGTITSRPPHSAWAVIGTWALIVEQIEPVYVARDNLSINDD